MGGVGGVSTHPAGVVSVSGNLHGSFEDLDGGKVDAMDVIGELDVVVTVAVAATRGVIGLE